MLFFQYVARSIAVVDEEYAFHQHPAYASNFYPDICLQYLILRGCSPNCILRRSIPFHCAAASFYGEKKFFACFCSIFGILLQNKWY